MKSFTYFRLKHNLIVLALGWLAIVTHGDLVCADDWPQWRGPGRSNVSKESDLLTVWPEHGPALAWEFNGLGDGVVPVAVCDGRVFCTGNQDGNEYCYALSETTGRLLWSAKLGPAAEEIAIMRWLNQRTPTVDGERLYVVMVSGEYVCLNSATGEEIWRVNAINRFHAKRHSFGYCDYPLIEGELLIVAPGGSNASVAALEKESGKVVWTCYSSVAGGQAHSAMVAAEIRGVRQFVAKLNTGLIGVRATDGKLLWEYPCAGFVAVTHNPLVEGDSVYYASGYTLGQMLLEIDEVDGKFTAREVFVDKQALRFASWLGSLTQVENHVFVNPSTGMACIDRKTGKPLWWHRDRERYVYTIANHQIYFWTNSGRLGLAALDTQQYRELCHFRPFDELKSKYGITFPVVANGRLYVRDLERLKCFDIHSSKTAGKQTPDAVFVPTPVDVVPRVLELASLRPDDLVMDLGSGDGRLLIGAVKSSGCRAVGVEFERELVQEARRSAAKAGVDQSVTFEQGDLFDYDFSQADVLLLYILPGMLERLKPKFDALRPGSRIVCHEFAIPGVRPERVVEVAAEDDGQARRLYRYVVPLQADAAAKQ